MSKSFLKKNLDSLKRLDASLHTLIEPFKGSKLYEVIPSKSGPLSLVHIDDSGIKKQIHSTYDPIAETSRYLDSLKIEEHTNFFVLGLGLGYQVLDIIQRISSRANIYIFEKDPELFALAMRNVDLSRILDHPGVRLFVGVKPDSIGTLLEPVKIDFTLNEFCIIRQKPLMNMNLEYYGGLLREIEKYFNECRINLKTQVVHSKLYYKNIFSNLASVMNSPGVSSLKGSLNDIPAIICSAGPSLDRNIQLVKSARQRFFLIAVATALKPLLHNGIQPDVVFSIDPDDLTISSFDLASDISDYWLIYNSTVPDIIPRIFPKRRLVFDSEVYLANWFKKHTEDKGSLGKIFSVAHSAVKFAHFTGCSPIILVGQDLAFSRKRLHCRHSFYNEKFMDTVEKLKPLAYWENFKYQNLGPNLTPVMDIYGCPATSTLSMKSYNEIFSEYFDNSHHVLNATEGGIPIKGIQNLSLREALYKHCKKPGSVPKNPFEKAVDYKNTSFKFLPVATSQQIQLLKDIGIRLSTLESQYLSSKAPDLESMRKFVKEMKNLYGKIQENNETVLLLQEYDFAGFSNWYRFNNKILNKAKLSDGRSLIEEEFERDHKFFDVLKDAVSYLIISFEKYVLGC